jgi:DhnA family fructose-bisphosphate aldolase class Ia
MIFIRSAAEIGVDLVKQNFNGSSFLFEKIARQFYRQSNAIKRNAIVAVDDSRNYFEIPAGGDVRKSVTFKKLFIVCVIVV